MFNLNKNETVFGLDIGYETIKLVQTKKEGGRITLVGASEIPLKERLLERDQFKNKADIANQIKEALRQAKPKSITAGAIVTSLPETFVFTKTIQLPKMSDKELAEAVPNSASEYLPIPVEEVYLDYQIMMVHPDEPQIDVFVAAAPKKLIDDYVELSNLIGMELAALETKSFAAGRAILYQDKTPGLVILHIGTEYSRISIWDSGLIRLSSTVSIGKNQLLENLGIAGKELGQAKITSDSYSEISAALSGVTDEIIAAIKYHQNRDFRPQPIKKIILCGSSASIQGLDQYIEKEVNIKTESFKLRFSDNYELPPQYIAAYGLSLRNAQE